MRSTLCLLPYLAILAACGSTPPKKDRFRAEPLKASSEEQGEVVKATMRAYWMGGEEFDTALKKCEADSAIARAVAMLMVVKMGDTESLQRRRQGTDFQLRTLEENVPYVRARSTIVRLREHSMKVVEEMIRHPHADQRRRGIEILSHFPAESLPVIEKKYQAGPAKYRRFYVEAVGGMTPSHASELLLLRWCKEEDWRVRSAALCALTGYEKHHLPMLRDVVREDSDQFVRRELVKRFSRFSDRATAATVVGYFADCAERGDRRGMTEAERTLVKMSKKPATRRGRIISYGLAYWQKWVRTLPIDGGNR